MARAMGLSSSKPVVFFCKYVLPCALALIATRMGQMRFDSTYFVLRNLFMLAFAAHVAKWSWVLEWVDLKEEGFLVSNLKSSIVVPYSEIETVIPRYPVDGLKLFGSGVTVRFKTATPMGKWIVCMPKGGRPELFQELERRVRLSR